MPNVTMLKLIYSEKATKLEKISCTVLTLLSITQWVNFKTKWEFFFNFVAFSENLNINTKLEMRLHFLQILTPLYDAAPQLHLTALPYS